MKRTKRIDLQGALDHAVQAITDSNTEGDLLPGKPLRLIWESEEVSVELAEQIVAQLHKRIAKVRPPTSSLPGWRS